MLEVFVTCLSRYAATLKDKEIEKEKSNLELGNNTDSNKVFYSNENATKKHNDTLLVQSDEPVKDGIGTEEDELGFLVMEGLTALLSSNVSNCNVFRECGGAKCVHGMVIYEVCRSKALGKPYIFAIQFLSF